MRLQDVGISRVVTRSYAAIEIKWKNSQTVPLFRTKMQKIQQKSVKNVGAFFWDSFGSSNCLIVLLDRLGQVLCRNKVWAISIGPSSRNFKIKNQPIGAHLKHEQQLLWVLSLQSDRACQTTYTVKFSALGNMVFRRNLIFTWKVPLTFDQQSSREKIHGAAK